jgi:LysR family cys regulon transcriptional activator
MAGLEVRFVLQAMNADVIKTYVRMGIGVGIIASVAFDESIDSDQVAIEVKHLLALNTTRGGN